MQVVSQKILSALRRNSKSLSVVVEFYHQDAVPQANGFDPLDPLFQFGVAASHGIGFRGKSYKQLISKGGIGKIARTINKQLSGFTLTLDNSTLEIIDFENEVGFEGLICIARLIDHTVSTDLTDSIVFFTGRCDEPSAFTKSSYTATINVKQILNATETVVPRRFFTTTDAAGRAPNNPEFEGFLYTPRGGSISYNEKVKRGGLLGLFGLKKTVTRTQPYSSHSDLQEETSVPLVLGRTQAEMIQFAYEDRGNYINFLGFWADGHEHGIKSIENFRSVTDGLPISGFTHKLGKKGGSVDDGATQANDDPDWIAAGIYSRTAWTRATAHGTTLESDDAAPTTVSMLFGQLLPIPNNDGTFTLIDFSDSAVAHSRWLLSSKYYFNLPDAWHDDTENLTAYNYGNHVLVDQSNTDTVLLNSNQILYAGIQYQIFKSTGALSSDYYRHQMGENAAIAAYGREADYQFYNQPPVDGDDWLGNGNPQLPPTQLRRRFTSNLQLLQQMRGHDFLFDILFAGSNLYLVQKSNGRFAHRHKKPEDFTFIKNPNAVGATSVEVLNINYWLSNKGQILIGANLPTSELRFITGVRYSTAGNSIPIAAGGGLVASGANLSGATDTTPASAIFTVTDVAGTKNYSIAGFSLNYNPQGGDSPETVAAFIAAQINSHEILNKKVKAVWTRTAQVKIESRFGFLDLDAPLQFVHQPEINNPATAAQLTEYSNGTLAGGVYQYAYSFVTREGETITSPITSITVAANSRIQTPNFPKPERVVKIRHYFSQDAGSVRRKLIAENDGEPLMIDFLPRTSSKMEPVFNTTAEECHRIAMAFVDKGNNQSNLPRSNMLAGTFTFPGGGKSSSVNQIKIKFRDAAADYKLTTLIVNDYPKQEKAKKINPLEISGAAIDNEHQARRIANSKLAELADGNKFYGFSSDGEALLLEEGDVICVTDESGRLVNEPARIEEIGIEDATSFPSASFSARKYRRYYYDDQVSERLVPLPIIQNAAINQEQIAPVVYLAANATNTLLTVGIRNYSGAPYYREVQISHHSDFSVAADISIFLQNAANTTGFVLLDLYTIERTSLANYTNLAGNESVYIRARHSSNGQTYGAWSAILQTAFTDANGASGSTLTPPPPPGGIGGTGDNPPPPPPPPPRGGCFAPQTQFNLSTNEIISFADLFTRRDEFIGTSILSFDANNHHTRRKILDVWRVKSNEFVVAKFKNGEKRKSTPSHRYWTSQKKFVAIKDLCAGDFVYDKNWNLVEIVSVEQKTVKHAQWFYNASIETDKAYFVGFAVSNLKPAPVDDYIS